MNNITTVSNKATTFEHDTLVMSSLEIAELTGKIHSNVTRDIRVMLEQLGMRCHVFEGTHVHPQNGQRYPIFNLPKNLSIGVVSGYNPVLRMKIIDRWLELETQAVPTAPQVPTNFREALALALEQQVHLEQAQAQSAVDKAQLAIAAPVVAAYGVIVADKKVTICQVPLGHKPV